MTGGEWGLLVLVALYYGLKEWRRHRRRCVRK
jgi:hypothetical protein